MLCRCSLFIPSHRASGLSCEAAQPERRKLDTAESRLRVKVSVVDMSNPFCPSIQSLSFLVLCQVAG